MKSIRATIWETQTTRGTRFIATVGRPYKDGDEWKQAGSFGRDDLQLRVKVFNLAHTWITNAFTEALNSKITSIKRRVGGFRKRHNFKAAILFYGVASVCSHNNHGWTNKQALVTARAQRQ